MIILQFTLGLRDSLLIVQSVARYLYPQQKLSFWLLMSKLLRQEKNDEIEESQQIANKAFESVRVAIKFLAIVIVLGLAKSFVESYINAMLGFLLYWLIIVIIYSQYAAGMWMRTQEITQESIKMEYQYYESRQFICYQIDQASPILVMDQSMTRIIFSLLFQVQSNLVCSLIGTFLPFPFNLLKIPIYALFISIQNISAKIPYKTHLAYYYHQNMWYLIGLNFLFSCYLHVSSFPLFTGILWFVMPWYLLNSIPREPPSFKTNGEISLKQYLQICLQVFFKPDVCDLGAIQIQRNSYFEHIQEFNKNNEYQQICVNHKSYIQFPTRFVPFVQQLLSKLLTLIHGHQRLD